MHRFETRAYAGMVRAFAEAGVAIDDLKELDEHSLLDACDAFWISDEIRVEVIRTMPWAEVERMFQGPEMPHCERWPVTASAILQRRECPLVLAVLLYVLIRNREGRKSLGPSVVMAASGMAARTRSRLSLRASARSESRS